MEKHYDIIQKNNLFHNISQSNFSHLLKCLNATIEKYDKDNLLIIQGDSIKRIGIILDGVIDIIKEDYMGNKNIISRLQIGDNFGEIFVCANIDKSPVSVYSETNSTVLFLNYQQITHMCSSSCNFHNQLIQNLLKNLAQKSMKLNENINYLSKKTIRSKISTYLINKIQSNENLIFSIEFNRNELSEFLNVNRSALSRELSKMKKEGTLNYKKNMFNIISPFKLYKSSLGH